MDTLAPGYSLSPIQQGMLYHHVRAPRSGVDIEQMVLRLREDIDPETFRRAWQALVDRYPGFQTSFEWDGAAQPRQFEHAGTAIEWLEHDLRGSAGTEQQQKIADFLRADRERGFDLSVPPLCRGTLFRLDDAEWEFVWTFHHICADGHAYPGLIREALDFYERGVAEPVHGLPLPVTYRDYVRWLDADLALNRDHAKSYWQETLRGFTSTTPLPDALEAGALATGYAEVSLHLSRDATAKLEAFADDCVITVNTLVLAAWARLLAVHSDAEDVVFGQTRACRRDTMPGAENIVGVLINTVPVRVSVDPDAGVVDWLRTLRASQNRLRRFERSPLADIQAWSELSANRPLFESLVVFTPRLIGAAFRDEGGAWLNREIRFIEQTNYPLTLFAYHEPDLLLKLAYDRSRVTDAAATRCLRQVATLLEALPLAAESRVAELGLLGADERRLLTTEWNATAAEYARSHTIHGLFEAQAARTPSATAVVFRDQSLTYEELNRRANRLARRLQACGAAPERLVGVFLSRSSDLVVALLAVLKSGAAYVPMDPAFPRQRLAWMLEDTQATVVVTERALADALPVAGGTQIVLVDADGETEASSNLTGGAQPTDLAYVIFTSGSSGRPKGVMVEHRNVTNFFTGMDHSLGFSEPGTWLAVTSISFDISVLELFWTLTRGFNVIVQEDMRAAKPTEGASVRARRKMDFSLFYFAADAADADGHGRYRLLMEGARYADLNGFAAIWTPERHFHAFGGLYPNPAVTSAAIAGITSRIQIRAGSIVLPLHNPIRVAEEWSVVDNLSGGRVGLSFASGWHAGDFALMPQNYGDRKDVTFRGIETVRSLWRGETVTATDGHGDEISLRIYPPPVQRDPPIWVTSAGDIGTFRMAGQLGVNLLTNLLGQKIEELAGKIAAYRASRLEHGHADDGTVTLMLHTFVGADMEDVRHKVHDPFVAYLKTSTDLIKRARWDFPAFANAPGQQLGTNDHEDLSEEDLEVIVDHAFQRYFETSGLFGTPETCSDTVDRLQAIGVDEIACLIDFGVEVDSVISSLSHLNEVRRRFDTSEDFSIAGQIRRHQVTHLQCTPSLARVLVEDTESLNALRSLKKLVLGGEALPPRLAAQLAPVVAGDLVNMYGPTETTIWSTSATIDRSGGPVTIGRPIANTRTYIVDRQLQPLPVGIAGELLIGGEGVTRGYLNRPDLTDERFVPDTICGGGRLYRTGDRVRYREDGAIEFLGRLDQQVKISGYRIEPGEIERTLEAHPAVQESVVVARENAAGEPALVAFVTAAATARDTADWRALWDRVYHGADGRSPDPPDPTMNTAGWISSYTGTAIPAEQMAEWVDRTVERIAALRPRRVLEIGSGTGMLLFRIAPLCDRYSAIDFSDAAVAYVRNEAARQGLTNVTVDCAPADELSRFAPGSFDAVVLNSVVQYFPDAAYLVKVLERAASLVAPGGAIFVGDVRSLPLLEAFHTAVELERAGPALGAAALRQRIRERTSRESELVLSPDFFRALQRRLSSVTEVSTQLKRGRHRNELTCFRYDAILRIGSANDASSRLTVEDGSAVTIETVRDRLAAGHPVVAFTGIPDRRVAKAIRAIELVAGDGGLENAGEIRAKLASEDEGGIDPEDLYTVAAAYNVRLSASAEMPGFYDAVFWRDTPAPPAGALSATAVPERPLADYANNLAAKGPSTDLVHEVRDFARQRLPEYMVPNTIIVLDSLPRTANGKLDRNALPAADPERPVAKGGNGTPESDLEKTITRVLKDLLGHSQIGVHDNFFDLGANSLMMMRANARLREALKRDLTLLELFEYPTVSALAAHLDKPATASAGLEQSQQRAQARIGALQRRRVGLRSE